jgi:hypothetical protein
MRVTGGTGSYLSVSAMDASSIAGPDAPLLREPASEPDLSPLMAQSARGRMVMAPKWRVYFSSQVSLHRPASGGLTESLVKFGIARRAGSDGRGAYPRRCGRVRRATWSEVRLNRTRSAAGISREPCEPRFPRSPARRSEKMRSADEHESGLGRSTTRAGPLARRRQRARRTHLAHPRRRVDLPRRRTLPPRGAEAPASVGARR